jgi:hypothetical protein
MSPGIFSSMYLEFSYILYQVSSIVSVPVPMAGPALPPKLKTSMADPREVPELENRERNAFGACPSVSAVNGCRNVGTNAQRVVRTHFTLIQVGHFC